MGNELHYNSAPELGAGADSAQLMLMATFTTNNGRPVLDEVSFQKLLAAAYVLQQHNEQSRITEPTLTSQGTEVSPTESHAPSEIDVDYTRILGEIVECQHQIQMRHLNLHAAIGLIATRAKQIAHADGSAVGLLEQEDLLYWAASGSAVRLAGSRVKAASCLPADCVSTGTILQCPDVRNDVRLDPETCRRQGINAIIAVPVFYDGKIMGCLELHFANANGYQDHDVRTCQLMAGLVTEGLARTAELELQQIFAAEHATTTGNSQKLKLELEPLANGIESVTSRESALCPECSNPIRADEIFCGMCGTEKTQPGSGDLQSKWASMWRMSEANKLPVNQVREREPDFVSGLPLANLKSDHLQQELTSADGDNNSRENIEQASKSLPPAQANAAQGKTSAQQLYPWVSAARAKAWLESLNGVRSNAAFARFWKMRRADVYLAIAIILVVAAVGWGVWSNSGSGATVTASSRDNSATGRARQRRKQVEEPKLSLTDRLLVALGIAEPPPAPVYNGNPETKVWVDLHTALYYCPGADLYGNTPKGKFTSQRDAQLDQFEPAYRKACD